MKLDIFVKIRYKLIGCYINSCEVFENFIRIFTYLILFLSGLYVPLHDFQPYKLITISFLYVFTSHDFKYNFCCQFSFDLANTRAKITINSNQALHWLSAASNYFFDLIRNICINCMITCKTIKRQNFSEQQIF